MWVVSNKCCVACRASGKPWCQRRNSALGCGRCTLWFFSCLSCCYPSVFAPRQAPSRCPSSLSLCGGGGGGGGGVSVEVGFVRQSCWGGVCVYVSCCWGWVSVYVIVEWGLCVCQCCWGGVCVYVIIVEVVFLCVYVSVVDVGFVCVIAELGLCVSLLSWVCVYVIVELGLCVCQCCWGGVSIWAFVVLYSCILREVVCVFHF